MVLLGVGKLLSLLSAPKQFWPRAKHLNFTKLDGISKPFLLHSDNYLNAYIAPSVNQTSWTPTHLLQGKESPGQYRTVYINAMYNQIGCDGHKVPNLEVWLFSKIERDLGSETDFTQE